MYGADILWACLGAHWDGSYIKKLFSRGNVKDLMRMFDIDYSE